MIRFIDCGQIEALYKTKTWVEVLEPSLNSLILKEKRNRTYPNISEGDYVKIIDKGKGNYVLRKETRSQWSEKGIK